MKATLSATQFEVGKSDVGPIAPDDRTACAAVPAAPADELVSALLALQRLISEHGDRIASIDVNPFLVTRRGCIAVDALIALKA